MNSQSIKNFKYAIYERLLYPLYMLKYGRKFGNRSITTFKHLGQTQWLSRDEINSYQIMKLKKLVNHIYYNVPFYRDIMQSTGIKPEDIRSLEDLNYFPVLTKKDINDNFDNILSKDFKSRMVIKASTGGTTGDPLIFYRDFNTRFWTEAALLRGWSWTKYRIGDTVIKFSNNDFPSLLGKMRTKLINMYYFPAFAEKDQLVDYFTRLNSHNQFCLTGLSSNLYRIAVECARLNIDYIRFPVIFTTAEMLYDYRRDLLEKTFQGKVYDYYGCNEIGSLAYECDHDNKHITDEHVIIETINSNGKSVIDSPGEITITDLDNYAMPFIRYRNGDVGTITDKSCPCKRELRVLKSVDGRSQELLKTSKGEHIPSGYFPSKFKDLAGIKRYQVIQHDIHRIELKIVKSNSFSQQELSQMIDIIRDKVGITVNIEVNTCDHIPLTAVGKMRLVVTHIP